MKLYLFYLFVAFYALMCNPRKPTTERTYALDYGFPKDSCLYSFLKGENINMILGVSGNYYFSPSVEKLKKYEGLWTEEFDLEGHSMFKFRTSDGMVYESDGIPELKIATDCGEVSAIFYYVE